MLFFKKELPIVFIEFLIGFWKYFKSIFLFFFNVLITLLFEKYLLNIIICLFYISFVYFNIILLGFNNFLFFIPFLLVLFFSWFFFLKNNFMYVRLIPNYSDKLINSSFLKKYNNSLYINYSLYLVLYLFISFYFFSGSSESFWYGHMYISDFSIKLVLILFFFLFVSYFIFLNTKKSNIIVNNDYYFSLISTIIMIPFFYFSNSLFNFLFFLEIVSVLIFYKFVVSKFWFNEKFGFFKKTNILERVFSRNYLNVLFFQYWINFFSSVIIIISLINLLYLYGSTEWFFLNLLNNINNNSLVFNDFEFNILLWVSFFFSLFIKIGITPSHLFKIEIYKGIPFISIFFYTTYYFLGYFLFVTVMFQYYFNSFKIFFNFFLLIFLLLGLLYTIFLLFDVSFTKAFFAYSTVVNSISFMILLLNNI